MPKTRLQATIPMPLEVSNRPLVLVVRKDGKKRGTLRMSRGGVSWTEARQKAVKYVRWDDLIEFLEWE